MNKLVKKTELKKINDKLYIKDESQQTGGSFKIRGVSYNMLNILEEEINKDNSDRIVYLVTQSTGNHAIALLTTLLYLKDEQNMRNLYPNEKINITFIGIIYGIKHTPENKKVILADLATKTGSVLDFSAHDYDDALQKRNRFMDSFYCRYVGHGDRTTMEGYSFTADEIHEQLLSYNIDLSIKINLLLPIGAGGSIGIANRFKSFRPNSNIVIIQTDNLNSFIKSFQAGTKDNIIVIKNDDLPLDENGKTVYPYADGIAVDAPEIDALKLAYTCVDNTFVISEENAKKEIVENEELNSFVGSSRMVVNSYFKILSLSNNEKIVDDGSVTIMFLTERK